MEGEIRVEEFEGGIEAFEVVCKIWALAVAGGNGALVVKGKLIFYWPSPLTYVNTYYTFNFFLTIQNLDITNFIQKINFENLHYPPTVGLKPTWPWHGCRFL